MAHIHTEPGQHDVTSSALIVRLDTPSPQILLHIHKKYGRLMQPGGHVELTETPWQAVLHEITEETGYNLEQLVVLQPKIRLKHLSNGVIHPVPACESTHIAIEKHFHTDRAYAFATYALPADLPAKGESTDLFWYDAAALVGLPDTEIGEDIRNICLFVLTVCAISWEQTPLTDFEADI